MTEFRSPLNLSKLVIFLLGAVLLLDVLGIWSGMLQLDLLERARAGAVIGMEEANGNDGREQVIAVLYMIGFFGCGIAFMVWAHRIYSNLPHLTAEPLRYTAGWAAGAFLVPFLNLVRPYQILREAWDHSTRSVDGVSAPAGLLGIWWGSWLLSNVAGQISFRYGMSAGEELDALITMTELNIFSNVVSVPAAILAMLVVHRLKRCR
jgi:hypothetical protein